MSIERNIERKRNFTTYEGEFAAEPTEVRVGNWREVEDGEIEWRVVFPESGKERWVPECDLSPAPDAPELNSERLAALCDRFESPLVQVAAIEGIIRYAENIAFNEAEFLADMEGELVHGPSWVAAAKRAAEIVNPSA